MNQDFRSYGLIVQYNFIYLGYHSWLLGTIVKPLIMLILNTLVGTCNKIVDYSDVVGASPVGAAPTTSSF